MSLEGDFIGFFEGSITEPFEELSMRTADDVMGEITGVKDVEQAVKTLLDW